jgi:hypothetical protein
MNKYIIGCLAIVAAVGIFFAGEAFVPKVNPLGGYNPPVASAQGFVGGYAVSSTIAATVFCSPANVQVANTAAAVTITFPAGTSTFAACPSLSNNLGASVSGLIVNDGTNTATFSAGTGDVFKCSQGNTSATSSYLTTCSASSVVLTATSTISYNAYFDTSSSTFDFVFSPAAH